ncbi:MAG: HAD-IA family hydrolase [Candidatus Hydrogenedentes bacterium]|nr:HAD-IA family hydrolase [Candidatus Hydrogenedentota bacterium]
MIDLIIFDFDGLILDTETTEFQAWQEIYGEFSVSLALDAWADSIGTRAGAFDPIAHLEAVIGREVPRAELRERHRLRFYQLLSEEALRPGIVAYLDDADRLGIKLAVASSASRDWVEGHLKRHGIVHRFACIVTVENVTHAKPDPELFNLALARTGVPADRALVLEDSPNGLLAANRAGIFAVAVPNPVTAELHLGHADLTVPSLAEFSLERLIEEIATIRKESSPEAR